MTDRKKKTEAEEPETSFDAETMQQQISELTDALQRERADVMNVRRRHDEQIGGLKNTIKASIVRDLLPVIDNFERALKHVPEPRHAELVSAPPADDSGTVQDDAKKFEDFVKGVQGVVKQFETTLEELGVQRIKTTGEPFDPKFHEAVSMEEGEGTTEVVSEELQAGYKIGDEVIRHAMVRVKTT